MSKGNGVSAKTHTKKQLDDYANQHNPNSKAYKARIANDNSMKSKKLQNATKKNAIKQAQLEKELGVTYPTEWMCYSNPYDFF